jgi:hypothetical protein
MKIALHIISIYGWEIQRIYKISIRKNGEDLKKPSGQKNIQVLRTYLSRALQNTMSHLSKRRYLITNLIKKK